MNSWLILFSSLFLLSKHLSTELSWWVRIALKVAQLLDPCLFPVCPPNHSPPFCMAHSWHGGTLSPSYVWLYARSPHSGPLHTHLLKQLTRTSGAGGALVPGVCSQRRTCIRLSPGYSRARATGSGRLEV